MNWKSAVISLAVIGLVGYIIDANDKNTQKENAQRKEIAEQAVARVSTADPLQNLAGCMVNHASEISKSILASAVYKTSGRINMPAEEIESFNEIRNVLYAKCSGTYYQLIVDKYGSLTYPNLNHAFMEVLKYDFGVKGYIAIHETTQKAKEAIYVK